MGLSAVLKMDSFQVVNLRIHICKKSSSIYLSAVNLLVNLLFPRPRSWFKITEMDLLRWGSNSNWSTLNTIDSYAALHNLDFS